MTEQPKHGEPGHVCQRVELDVSDAIAGVIIRHHPELPDALEADAWSHGLSKRAAASILKDLARSWDEDADLEDSRNADMRETMADYSAEIEAAERARTAGLN